MAIRFPKLTVALVLGITAYMAMQLPHLRWETDARVYLPKGHPAIKYDEKVDDVFGVKDSLVIGIVNNGKDGIFNPVTLDRVARITKKIEALPGVIANRPVDVASLSTATIFVGTDTSIGSEPLMPKVPTDAADIARIKKTVYANSDLFVGNLVSKDGKATMIRARLKEGESNRYMTYWQIKGIVAAESGEGGGQQGWGQGGGNWGQGGGNWGQGGQKQAGNANWPQSGAQAWQQSGNGGGQQADYKKGAAQQAIVKNGDEFYLAGRPVIEVTSGLHAIQDMQVMIPLLLLAIAITLFMIFRTARGVILPLLIMGAAIIWTMGIMVLADVPLYTISTMLPVILVAVSIGDSVHLLSHYYDRVLQDAHRSSKDIVSEVISRLSMPLLTTSITTAVGFTSLAFATMPPFVVFGIFTVLGISISWLLTVTFIPAMLVLMKPKVGGYLAKRRALRVHSEQNRLTKLLVSGATFLYERRSLATAILVLAAVVASIGASKLSVDSSWMSDFRQNSDIVVSNNMFNNKFDGTIFLNVVVEGHKNNIFTSPDLLHRIEGLQNYVDGLPYVGGSRSIVDYIKDMNKTLHAGDENFNVIPATQAQIGQYLFLLSVSGRPQQLDEMVDYDYRQGLITFAIKTDHTQELRAIIDKARQYIDRNFVGEDVEVHFAGSANNSYVWADLLIGSQTWSILTSKISILLIAWLLFRSFKLGIYTVAPLMMTTLLVAGIAGFLSIPLDVSTALAAGVAIGVGVDFAIHYIFRYRDELAETGNPLLATQATMRTIGRTIVFNALVVTVGFGVLFASQFPPDVKLGVFVASYMAISCLMSLVVLPVLFAYSRAPVPRQETVHAT
jgi:predicted RND superfamily exporter protein